MASIQNIPPPSPRRQQLRRLQRLPKDIMDWTKKQYNQQYDRWAPWLEDQYLYYFTKDNKASYATKGELDKTKITGNEGVDKLQDDVHGAVTGQVGQGGLAQPLGDALSKEGVNRAERGGRDERGEVAPGPMGKVGEGAKAAGGYLGGWLPGGSGKKERGK